MNLNLFRKKNEAPRLTAEQQKLIKQVGELEPEIEKLSDEALLAKTGEFKERLVKVARDAGGEKLDQERCLQIEEKELDRLLPEAFAVAREAAKRALGQRHFDVQLVGGLTLHQNKIAEMKTGEGKTLVATLPLYLNALSGRGAHLVTVNDYLSRRDAGWMGPVYHKLGLSVGVIGHEASLLFDPAGDEGSHSDERLRHFVPVSRAEAYAADITYGTNNEFGFDYLRDNMATALNQCVQRTLHYAIVDEVDSILIDEARTPLIISRPAEESGSMYAQFARLVEQLKPEIDYEVDEKERRSTLTDAGIKKAEQISGVKNLFEADSVLMAHHLEEALKAKTLFRRDKDYIIKDGEIVIVDEFTGRLMPGRRFNEGLHQALEAKEGVEVKQESDTLATISFQNYFRLYHKLGGMTGTAKTEEEEFWKIYGLAVEVIPTNKPMVRRDGPDKIYQSETGKWQAIMADIKKMHEAGQPVLVGTVSIEKNELLSDLLERNGVPHKVLNAKNHEQEALIIEEAGNLGAVTVATNMAGRGTDIKVVPEAMSAGGLHVLGTERHESRRIDNQLRGRTGRQGDPGSSQFYVSLEDDLMRIFGGDRLKNMMAVLKVPEDMPIESGMVSKALESAQRRVEGHNFDIRKHVVEYDDVMNKHRKRIYRDRRRILEQANLKADFGRMIEEEVRALWVDAGSLDEEVPRLRQALGGLLGVPVDDVQDVEQAVEKALRVYTDKETRLTSEVMRELERAVSLRANDVLWIDHLNAMEQLRHGIGLVGYAQREPLVEYKARSYELFQGLLLAIRRQTVELLFRAEIVTQPPPMLTPEAKESGPSETLTSGAVENEVKAEKKERVLAGASKVGRNDPCPCGKKKPDGTPVKFKHCHGA